MTPDTWGLFVNERWFSEVDQPYLGGLHHRLPVPVDQNHPTVSEQLHARRALLRPGRSLRSQPALVALLQDRQSDQPEPRHAYGYGQANQSYPMNPALYDLIGRFYHVGFRILD